MTIFSVIGDQRFLTVRYLPVMTWLFVAIAAYGIADVVNRMLDGRLVAGTGPFLGLAGLAAMALYALAAGGQFVVASFDRGSDLVRVQRYGLDGISTTDRPLSDLSSLDVRVLRRAQHRIELRFRSGERLPLTRYYVVTFNRRGLGQLSEMLRLEPQILRYDEK
ncbi:MAG: hypothetical protein AB4911_04525 [Oscillochloridaceae bacterium umkhey_bin13]